MRAAWADLCRRIACPPASNRFDDLDALYSETHRAYHTWFHIGECLDVWERCPESAGDPDAFEFAIWLHDAVYRPLRSDNEEASAMLAATWLKECPAGRVDGETVSGLILATRHPTIPESKDQALMQDVDLHVLGSSPERYFEYEQQIRREYRLVPAPLFRRRRAQLLEGFLEAEFLFHTSWFREEFEAKARRNLGRALANLR